MAQARASDAQTCPSLPGSAGWASELRAQTATAAAALQPGIGNPSVPSEVRSATSATAKAAAASAAQELSGPCESSASGGIPPRWFGRRLEPVEDGRDCHGEGEQRQEGAELSAGNEPTASGVQQDGDHYRRGDDRREREELAVSAEHARSDIGRHCGGDLLQPGDPPCRSPELCEEADGEENTGEGSVTDLRHVALVPPRVDRRRQVG